PPSSLPEQYHKTAGRVNPTPRVRRDHFARRLASRCPRLDTRRRVLRDLRPVVLRLERRRHRRPERPDPEARLRRGTGRRLHLAHAGGRVAQLPRLRRDRLLPRRARLRHQRRLQAAGGRSASPRYRGARRHGVEPQLERTSVLPGGPARHDVAVSRVVPFRAHGAGKRLAPFPRAGRVLLRAVLVRHAGLELRDTRRAGRSEKDRHVLAARHGRGRLPAGCGAVSRGARRLRLGVSWDACVPARARLAATLLLTLPGTPFIYYGEEIGMTGDKPDPRLRTPMQWSAGPGLGFTSGKAWESAQPDSLTTTVAAEDADAGSLLNLYRRLIHLRKQNEALATGRLLPLSATSPHVAAYLRRT